MLNSNLEHASQELHNLSFVALAFSSFIEVDGQEKARRPALMIKVGFLAQALVGSRPSTFLTLTILLTLTAFVPPHSDLLKSRLVVLVNGMTQVRDIGSTKSMQ
jgi:hypothetical protein